MLPTIDYILGNLQHTCTDAVMSSYEAFHITFVCSKRTQADTHTESVYQLLRNEQLDFKLVEA